MAPVIGKIDSRPRIGRAAAPLAAHAGDEPREDGDRRRARRLGQSENMPERRRRERAGQTIDVSALIEQGGGAEEKLSRGLGHARLAVAVAMAARNAVSMTMRGRA